MDNSRGAGVKLKVGDKVVDITTGSRFTVISKVRVNGEVECELDGTRELFLKPAENLQLLAGKNTHLECKEEVQSILEQRGSRYGSFSDLAILSQDLKGTMRASPGWKKLTASQKEALEMVQHKIARMLNGDPTYEDNAVDIVGYSTLLMKNMQGDLKI